MLIKNDVKEKTRLVGKIGGYWVDVEKHAKEYEPGIVKNWLAVAALFIGIGLFYFLFP